MAFAAVVFWVAAAQEVSLLSSEQSSTGSPVTVIQTRTHRVMLLGRVVIGAEYTHDWARDQAAFSGMALMQTVAFLRPAPSRVLAIGLGSGTAPAFLRQRGIATDVVEVHEAVVQAARAHFLFGTVDDPGRTVVADALVWLQRTSQRGPSELVQQRYQVVLSDLFDGDNPTASISYEHFDLIKRQWLEEGGVFALNLVAFGAGKHARLSKAAARTLRSCFRHVLVFADHDTPPDDARRAPSLATAPCNLLFFASDAPIVFDPPPHQGDPPGSSYHLHSHFLKWQVPELAAAAAGEDGEILTNRSADHVLQPVWLREDGDAIRLALWDMQLHVLPDSGWEMVEGLLLDPMSGRRPPDDHTTTKGFSRHGGEL